ncbi:MAG: PAS domain S-box protein [Eubacterium sp.]|nr:PAS domain S-box protein [Eubacterium sp.]
MTKKIFRAILSISLVILATSLLVITAVLYNYFGEAQRQQLRDELRFAAQGTNQLGEEYLKGLSSNRYRLTWIAKDGTVLYENHANRVDMENHADREEFKEALENGTGSSSRYSTTLMTKTLYEAVQLPDKTVLRIAIQQASVMALMVELLQPIIFIFLLAALMVAWVSRRMAEKIVQPLNQLDLEMPLENDTYKEVSPLLRRIHLQNQEIQTKMQMLRYKQEEFQQIISNMQEGLILLDDKQKIISINPSAERLFFADERCIGKDFLTICRTYEMQRALQNAKKHGNAQYQETRNDSVYRFDISCVMSDHVERGLLILAVDVTEQVNAERNRQEFTANVSHELKTPIQSIVGSAELIENGLVKTEDLPRFVGHIRKEATRLVTLIEDIIRLSQMDENKVMPEEDISIRSIAEEVKDSLTDMAEKKHVTLQVSGHEGCLHGVNRMVYEIVYNLCDNAIKYNKDGGYVRINITDSADDVCIQIEDNGIGIAPEYQEKIFERFFRVDKSHSKLSGGTGLGLSIVKHAVKHHNGRIEVDSKLGEGTCIRVYLSK